MMKNRHVNRWQKWRKCKTFPDFVSNDFNEIIKLWTSEKTFDFIRHFYDVKKKVRSAQAEILQIVLF